MRPGACVIAIVAALLILPTGSYGETIFLRSGEGFVGEPDPNTQWSGDDGATWQQAYIIAPHPTYDTIAETKWINRDATSHGPTFETTRFRTVFDLPDDYTAPNITVSVHADNVASVYLNGTFLGGQPDVSDAINFQDPPERFSIWLTPPFAAGENVLEIRVYNYYAQVGLDFEAVVTYETEALGVEAESWGVLKGRWRE